MNSLLFAALSLAGVALVALFVARGLMKGGFLQDKFPSESRKFFAIFLLIFVLLICVVTPFSTGLAGRQVNLKQVSPISAFALHALLLVFLVAYYFLAGKQPVVDFLRLRGRKPLWLAIQGLPIAAFAWGVTVVGMVALQLFVVSARGGLPAGGAKPSISPVIPWIVSQGVGFKIAVVISAMIFEELFFRSFLQPRIGAVGATIFFTLAHGVYGEPMMLFGILILATVLAVTFEIYGNAIPGIIAHGAFDAFEIFVLIPLALKFVAG